MFVQGYYNGIIIVIFSSFFYNVAIFLITDLLSPLDWKPQSGSTINIIYMYAFAPFLQEALT